MSSPFTTQHSTIVDVVPATESQVRFLRRLLDERRWHNLTNEKYVARMAVLKLAITWAYEPMAETTPPEVSRQINSTVGQDSTYGERVNTILDYLRDNSANNQDSQTWHKPLTKDGATKLIGGLLVLPEIEQAPKPIVGTPEGYMPDVPEGRYALPIENSTVGNDIAFYKVDRPTEGKWAGYVFVKLLVGPDEQRLSRTQGNGVLRRIAEFGIEQASALYGQKTEKCGICGRRLTNKASRERGIGPDCAAKMGW